MPQYDVIVVGLGVTGTATLAEYQHGGSRLVQIHLTVSGLKPGQHGVHLHAVGKCEAPFTSAGGHYDPGPPATPIQTPITRTTWATCRT